MNMSYDEIIDEAKTLLEPEFAQRWPYANTVTVSTEVDSLIEKVATDINENELTVNGLFEACLKQL